MEARGPNRLALISAAERMASNPAFMGILGIIESPRLRQQVIEALRGFDAVEFAGSLETALQKFDVQVYALVLFDLAPGQTEIRELLEAFRTRSPTVRLLAFTTAQMLTERLAAIAAGIDDDLVRPFAPEEFRARVRWQLQHTAARSLPKKIAGEIEIDVQKRLVKRAGRLVDLMDREYRLLEYFMERRGEMVDRADIKAHLYDSGRGLKSNAIDSAICSLRKKLGANGQTDLIQTRRGLGYMFMPDVEPSRPMHDVTLREAMG